MQHRLQRFLGRRGYFGEDRAPCVPGRYTLAEPLAVHGIAQGAAARNRIAAVLGEPPSPMAPPPGCHFNPRCPLATQICREIAPPTRDMGAGRTVACHQAT